MVEVYGAWLAPDYRCFNVHGDGGGCYGFRDGVLVGRWELTMFDRSGAIG